MIAARIAYDSIRFDSIRTYGRTDARRRCVVVALVAPVVRSFVHVRVSVWVNRMKKFVAFVPLQHSSSQFSPE